MNVRAKHRLSLVVLLALFSCQERVVAPADVVRVELSPQTLSLPVGSESRFQVTFYDGQDNPLTGRAIAWSVEDGSVAAIADDGTVRAMAVGQTQVQAQVEGRTGTATLRVTSNTVGSVDVVPSDAVVEFGGTRAFDVVVRATDGTTLTDRTPSWATVAPDVATVDADGTLTGVGLGTTRVVASVEGVQGEALVAIVAPPLTGLRIEPPALVLQKGRQARLTVIGLKPDGSIVQGLPAAWRSLDAAVATVDAGGAVTAVGVGETRIEAGFGRFIEGSTVTVTPIPAASIDVQPGSATLLVNERLQFSATVRSAEGAVLDRAPGWSSTAASTAHVDDEGLVTALAEGEAYIIAALDGVRDSAHVHVDPRPIASVRVRPSESTLRPGETVRLTADVLADDGTVLTRPIDWSSANSAVASVNGSGVVTAHETGTALIRATAGNVTGTATVQVNPPPIVAIEVRPSSAKLQTGQTTTLSAVGRTVSGAERPVSGLTWSSSNSGVAAVSGGGAVTAVQPGTATITASGEGQTGSASIEVVRPPIVSLRIEPSTAELLAGQQTTLHAIGRLASGEEVTDLNVTWRSSNTAVASVDAGGRVLALLPGTAHITAAAEGVEGEATITVKALVGATSIDIVGGGFTLNVGESRQVSAVLRDNDGDVFIAPISWTTLQSSVATVSFTGLVRAQGAGSTYVVAFYKELRDSVRVTVNGTGSMPDGPDPVPAILRPRR